MSKHKYAVLIGEHDIKVTRILSESEENSLSPADRLAYDRDRSIGSKFYFGYLLEDQNPFSALLEAKEIERQQEAENV